MRPHIPIIARSYIRPFRSTNQGDCRTMSQKALLYFYKKETEKDAKDWETYLAQKRQEGLKKQREMRPTQ